MLNLSSHTASKSRALLNLLDFSRVWRTEVVKRIQAKTQGLSFFKKNSLYKGDSIFKNKLVNEISTSSMPMSTSHVR